MHRFHLHGRRTIYLSTIFNAIPFFSFCDRGCSYLTQFLHMMCRLKYVDEGLKYDYDLGFKGQGQIYLNLSKSVLLFVNANSFSF